MNKRNLLKAGLVAAMLSTAALMPATAVADTIKLKVGNWLPPVHHMTSSLRAWADELEQASGGEIEVEIMSAPLAKPNGQYDLAKNGIVDIAWSVAAFHPKRFWKLMAVETPFAANSAEAAGVAAWRWYEKHGFMAEDTADTKLLALFAHAPHLYHSSKPLASLADFNGLENSRRRKWCENRGSNRCSSSVHGPPGATHDAMAKGTIDISQFPWESVAGFRLAEVSGHHMQIPGGTYSGIFLHDHEP